VSRAGTIALALAVPLLDVARTGAQEARPLPRYSLAVKPRPERAEVKEVTRLVRGAIETAGWKEDAVADVEISIEWTFAEPGGAALAGTAKVGRWCAQVGTSWAGGGGSVRTHCVSTPECWITPVAPSRGALRADVATPIAEALRAEERARWTLRVRLQAAESTPRLHLEGADVSRWVQWSGDFGVLSVPTGKTVVVEAGRCRTEVAEARPDVAVASLTQVRQVMPEWKVNGVPAPRIRVSKGEAFELALALKEGRAGEAGGLPVPCAGDWVVSLGGSGIEAKPASRGQATWSWHARTTEDAGTVQALVHASGAADSSSVAFPLAFQPPPGATLWKRVQETWNGIDAGVKAIGGIVAGVAGIVAAIRRMRRPKAGQEEGK
jgi:hypothetical protein